MKEQNKNRTKWLHLRLTADEYARLQQGFQKTTCRKLSQYSRKILLGKPVVAVYRNQSLDDFMTEMMALRTELNGIGNNVNQAVKKLHTLQQISSFKAWILSYEGQQRLLLHKIEDIKNRMNQMADQWLQ